MSDEDEEDEELASEEEWDDCDHQNDGFSATDVDMYFELIAEATEDDLRAILQEEGLPVLPVRTIVLVSA